MPLSPTVLAILTDLAFGLFLLLLLHITRPAYLAFRRRRTGFGVVFDSVTGQPVDRATVSLRDGHGRIARTAVTEKDGRYRLMAPKGEYRIEVTKLGYTFPSVKDHGVITKNIPIDHVEKKGQRSQLGRELALPKGVQLAISGLSPFIAFGIGYVQQHSWVLWTMYACYLLALLNRLAAFKAPQPPFGTVRDDATGEPLPGVAVRLLNSKFNKVVETQVTSPKGRYAFIINKGAYKIHVTKRGYKGVILNFPHVDEDRFLLAKDVRLKKIPTRLTPLSPTLKGTLEPLPDDRHPGVRQIGDLT
jgi:5-hydroxyisourate hydrolase-like protein (transthyretin family)